MTTTAFWATLAPGQVAALARAEHDQSSERPWVVLAYRRTGEAVYAFTIVAGYNRWTGEQISWRVTSLDDTNYDMSNAIEVCS